MAHGEGAGVAEISDAPASWPHKAAPDQTARNDWHDEHPEASAEHQRGKKITRWFRDRRGWSFTRETSLHGDDFPQRQRDVEKPTALGQIAALIVILSLCLAVDALSTMLALPHINTWYARLVRPSWTPQPWVFVPVGHVLFTLMGLAAWLVWRRQGLAAAEGPMVWFLIQLMLTGLWSGLLFACHNPGAALVDLGLLWLAVLATMAAFWPRHRAAALLLVPSLGWTTWLGAATFGIWILNS